jgi:hypothetical protein
MASFNTGDFIAGLTFRGEKEGAYPARAGAALVELMFAPRSQAAARKRNAPDTWNGRGAGTFSEKSGNNFREINGGSDGTRTRGLRRDRPAL